MMTSKAEEQAIVRANREMMRDLFKLRAQNAALLEALRQGEVVVETYLDILKTTFPKASTTETGRVLQSIRAAIAAAEETA